MSDFLVATLALAAIIAAAWIGRRLERHDWVDAAEGWNDLGIRIVDGVAYRVEAVDSELPASMQGLIERDRAIIAKTIAESTERVSHSLAPSPAPRFDPEEFLPPCSCGPMEACRLCTGLAVTRPTVASSHLVPEAATVGMDPEHMPRSLAPRHNMVSTTPRQTAAEADAIQDAARNERKRQDILTNLAKAPMPYQFDILQALERSIKPASLDPSDEPELARPDVQWWERDGYWLAMPHGIDPNMEGYYTGWVKGDPVANAMKNRLRCCEPGL